MPFILRTDGLTGTQETGHIKLQRVARYLDEQGRIVAEVDVVLSGDTVIDEATYLSEVAAIAAHNDAISAPTPRLDPDQQAIDAFAGGDDTQRDAALRAMAKRFASR